MVPMLSPDMWVTVREATEMEPAGIQDVVPSPTGTSRLDRRGQRWLFAKGRLKPGATVAQAQANLDVVMRQLMAALPADEQGPQARAQEIFRGSDSPRQGTSWSSSSASV